MQAQWKAEKEPLEHLNKLKEKLENANYKYHKLNVKVILQKHLKLNMAQLQILKKKLNKSKKNLKK